MYVLITSIVVFLDPYNVMVRVLQCVFDLYLEVGNLVPQLWPAATSPLLTQGGFIILNHGSWYPKYPGGVGGGMFLMSVSWIMMISGWLSWIVVNRRLLFDWKPLMFQEMAVMFPGLMNGFGVSTVSELTSRLWSICVVGEGFLSSVVFVVWFTLWGHYGQG